MLSSITDAQRAAFAHWPTESLAWEVAYLTDLGLASTDEKRRIETLKRVLVDRVGR